LSQEPAVVTWREYLPPMNSDLERLIDLQKVDAQIARLNAEIAALPKRVQAIEAQLADARSRVDKAKAAIKADEQARRGFESEIQTHRNKISKYRDQSSSVKTNEQYKALMQEIDFAEQAIGGLEDKILETMLDVDAKQGDVKRAEADLKAETAEIEKEKAEARAKTDEDEAALKVLHSQRDELRGKIDEKALYHYERVAKARGTGVAEARRQRCMGCQVMLRPQVYNDVMTGNGVQVCDSCTRLLYYLPENEAPVDEKAKAASKGASYANAWLFIENAGENGAFAALANTKSGSAMRLFDAVTGKALQKADTRKGQSFKEAFSEQMSSGRHLWIDNQPNLEQDCKEELPAEILVELQRQVPDRPKATDSTTAEL
jgi:predicted  nucleic acid-binding Zn-ribbon protein